MFWLIAWVIGSLIFWMMVADQRQVEGKKPYHPVASLLIGCGFSAVVLIALAVLLSNPGLWNALSMGQR